MTFQYPHGNCRLSAPRSPQIHRHRKPTTKPRPGHAGAPQHGDAHSAPLEPLRGGSLTDDLSPRGAVQTRDRRHAPRSRVASAWSIRQMPPRARSRASPTASSAAVWQVRAARCAVHVHVDSGQVESMRQQARFLPSSPTRGPTASEHQTIRPKAHARRTAALGLRRAVTSGEEDGPPVGFVRVNNSQTHPHPQPRE